VGSAELCIKKIVAHISVQWACATMSGHWSELGGGRDADAAKVNRKAEEAGEAIMEETTFCHSVLA